MESNSVDFRRDIDPVTGLGGGPEELRRTVRSRVLGTGTLACPRCDAPVALPGPRSPADRLACPYCRHTAALRDFLSLGEPTRPARVEVRVRQPAQRKPVGAGRGANGLGGRPSAGSSSL
jgi:hypothetical protein